MYPWSTTSFKELLGSLTGGYPQGHGRFTTASTPSSPGAIPEFVEHGKSGFLFEPEDIEGMSNAIRNLAADPGLRRRMGEKARMAALKFDWRELVGKFVGLYTQYLG